MEAAITQSPFTNLNNSMIGIILSQISPRDFGKIVQLSTIFFNVVFPEEARIQSSISYRSIPKKENIEFNLHSNYRSFLCQLHLQRTRKESETNLFNFFASLLQLDKLNSKTSVQNKLKEFVAPVTEEILYVLLEELYNDKEISNKDLLELIDLGHNEANSKIQKFMSLNQNKMSQKIEKFMQSGESIKILSEITSEIINENRKQHREEFDKNEKFEEECKTYKPTVQGIMSNVLSELKEKTPLTPSTNEGAMGLINDDLQIVASEPVLDLDVSDKINKYNKLIQDTENLIKRFENEKTLLTPSTNEDAMASEPVSEEDNDLDVTIPTTAKKSSSICNRVTVLAISIFAIGIARYML
jgi:hypothetical protein